MAASHSRLLHVDALKALAAQAIVWHHLSAYGVVAQAAEALLPELIDALYHYGRMAVQVFLVVGGFLSANALAPGREPLRTNAGELGQLLARRYLRLAVPFFVAVLLTLACSVLAARASAEPQPVDFSAGQLLSHALLLHGVLGHESLTAGAWYVAIDLQLFAVLLGVLWCARRFPRAWGVAPAMVLVGMLASLWVFNLHDEFDDWAPYFFGAYGLGALVHWLGASRWRVRWLVLLSLLVLAALAYDFRARIMLALVTALVLALLQWRHEAGRPMLRSGRGAALIAHLGQHSYALFLVHYPVCLLAGAVFERIAPAHPAAVLIAMPGAWLLSNLAAVLFYRWVEAPAARLRPGRWPRPQLG